MVTRKDIFRNFQYANERLCLEFKNCIPAQVLDDSDFIGLYNSQDIKSTCEYFGINPDNITGILAKISDGDYTEVYFTESSRPYDIFTDYHPIDYYLE